VKSSYNSMSSAGSSHVRVVHHTGVRVPALGAPRRSAAKTGVSLTRWIVRSIMIATTAFALLDLFLLVSGGRH
jgi:hypothetical protein